MTFQLAEVAVRRQMFQKILMLIARLRAPRSGMKFFGVRKPQTDDGKGAS